VCCHTSHFPHGRPAGLPGGRLAQLERAHRAGVPRAGAFENGVGMEAHREFSIPHAPPLYTCLSATACSPLQAAKEVAQGLPITSPFMAALDTPKAVALLQVRPVRRWGGEGGQSPHPSGYSYGGYCCSKLPSATYPASPPPPSPAVLCRQHRPAAVAARLGAAARPLGARREPPGGADQRMMGGGKMTGRSPVGRGVVEEGRTRVKSLASVPRERSSPSSHRHPVTTPPASRLPSPRRAPRSATTPRCSDASASRQRPRQWEGERGATPPPPLPLVS